MSYRKIKTSYWCIGGGWAYSSTIAIGGDIISKDTNFLVGNCPKCNRKNSMTVDDNTIKAEGLGNVFKNTTNTSPKETEKIDTNDLTTPGRASESIAKYGSAAVTKNAEVALSKIPDVVSFFHTG